jgi:carboxypeptidase D
MTQLGRLVVKWAVLACLLGYASCLRRLAEYGRQDSRPTSVEEEEEERPGNATLPRRLADVATSHSIENLPGLTAKLVQYAGHITIDEQKSSNVFYWLIEAPLRSEELPLLVWLNGGPGCSSMEGLWLELGPLRLEGGRVSINPHSWHKVANLLFIDQPVGTGFAYTKSKTGYAKNDDMVNAQFYKFLTGFFAVHPRYVQKNRTRAFFMSGESHAGHYIPTIAAHILKQNEKIAAGGAGLTISLEGIALGNPWMDPSVQYDVSEFAHGVGLISWGQRTRLKELEKVCQASLRRGKLNSPICFGLLDKVVDASTAAGADKVLMYDVRKYVHSTSSFPPGHEALEVYLNRADVKQALHATSTPHKFQECTDPPFHALSHQDGKSVTAELVQVLDSGLRVLVFAGQFDLICNHVGVEKVLRNLKWKHQRAWMQAPSTVWVGGKAPRGYSRSYENLEYLLGKA